MIIHYNYNNDNTNNEHTQVRRVTSNPLNIQAQAHLQSGGRLCTLIGVPS